MSLSDDLVRIDMLVENMVKKIEKQYQEVAGDQDPLKVSVVYFQRGNGDVMMISILHHLYELLSVAHCSYLVLFFANNQHIMYVNHDQNYTRDPPSNSLKHTYKDPPKLCSKPDASSAPLLA